MRPWPDEVPRVQAKVQNRETDLGNHFLLVEYA